jgi:hypothetical protein
MFVFSMLHFLGDLHLSALLSDILKGERKKGWNFQYIGSMLTRLELSALNCTVQSEHSSTEHTMI